MTTPLHPSPSFTILHDMSKTAAPDKPLFTTLRFIPTNGNSSSGTRRIAAQACELCRRRKKRCIHTPDTTHPNVESNHSSTPPAPVASPSEPHAHVLPKLDRPQKRAKTSGATLSASHTTATSHSRFIGDLNPDVELLSGSTPNEPLRNTVGVWHSDDAHPSRTTDGRDMFTSSSLLHNASQPTQVLLAPLIEELCTNLRPTIIHYQALEDFYFESIEPILPAIDRTLYQHSPLESPARMLQEQIICILASLNPAVKEHLRLPNHDVLLSPADFARKLVGGMRLTIELSLVPDKTIIIRALIAMSLMTYGPESIDLTSQYFVRAVHLSYTIGIHLPQDQIRDQRVAGLFCYIWSIDRLHAAIQGRPIFMHAIDMGKHPRDCMVSQTPGFQTLVYIATLLDKTIALYRPGAMQTEIIDLEFPTFEEIITECDALTLPGNLLSTLELFYHAVGILSCRHRRGTISQGHLARNSRQISSAMQIISIMEEDTAHTSLPFVPYAVSLALSAAYRDFKHCKAANHRSRARKRLALCHRHLVSLGRVFRSAAFVSELAAKILRETESNENLQELPTPQDGDHQNGAANLMESVMDVTLGHDWNTAEMDGFLEGNLDPSLPWSFQDIEGFLSIPGFDDSIP